MVSLILQSLRPKQWPKNFFVFAGLLFTLDHPHPLSDYLRVGAAFLLFCILSGVAYIINDCLDAELDRKHPTKRNRPIASGRLPTQTALVVAAGLIAVGIPTSFLLKTTFGIIATTYTVLMLAYSLYLKHLVLLDAMTISGGFVLRAVAGTEVLNVSISPWLLLCTVLLALFLAFAKRRAELASLEDNATATRISLGYYSIPFIDQLLNITASVTIITYSLYTFSSETALTHRYMIATLPFVLYGIFRYILLVQHNKGADNPETLLVTDKPLLINIALWVLTSAIAIAIRHSR